MSTILFSPIVFTVDSLDNSNELELQAIENDIQMFELFKNIYIFQILLSPSILSKLSPHSILITNLKYPIESQ
jgi:hypothetical protein